MARVNIYTTPTCTFCSMAKSYFKENNINYEEFDVSEDREKAQEMIEKSGQMGVPVIDIDGNLVVGFDKARIKQLLGL